MWEKEKLLVTSNFSLSHIVFKRHVLQTHKNQGLFGKRLILYQTVKFGPCKDKGTGDQIYTAYVLVQGHKKEKMLVTNVFSFFYNVFKMLLSQDCLKLGLCG